VEFRAIRRNGRLIDRILATIADQAPSDGLTPAAAQANIDLGAGPQPRAQPPPS
jgi:hypothetical protein